MNVALWIVQGVLASMFLMAGMMKLTKSKDDLAADPRMRWVDDVAANNIKVAGVTEAMGGLGLILPWALDIVPALTPWAAVGLSVQMALAVNLHRKRGETGPMMMTAMLLAGAVFVAWGRFGDLA
jgi:uncharacterized membrane protein YphA (DoxX/SURF4 family)